jgi:hypothetical protein
VPNIFDQFWFTGYESAYFNSDMGLYQEYLGALEELKVKKLRGIVSQDSEIAPENQLVYNEATTRLMDYDSYLNNLGTNIWERYAQIHPLMNPPVNNVPDRTNAVTSAVELNISDQPMVPGGQSATLTNNDSNQPNDGVNDITTQPKVEQWNARYKNLIIEIANSSPERREQLIREHQPELNKFQDSKINVKNDLEYLRNVQDHLNAKLAGRDSAFVKNFYYNVETISGPTNTAFVDAECSDEDSKLGYTLEPNENNVLWRVNSAGIPHPDDLDKFFEQKRVIQLAFNKTVEESTLEPKIRAMTPQESFQWGGTPLIPFFATGAASTELKAVQGSSNAGDSGSRLTDADREAGYIQVLLNDGLTYVRVRNEDGRWMIHLDDVQLAQDINNSVAKGMLLAGIIPGILKGVWSGAKSAYNALTQESSKVVTGARDIPYTEWEKLEIQSKQMYNEIRNSPTDISTIAKNTGMSEARVQRIKNHLFNNEHILWDGVRKFDPDFDIAQAWKRLESGTHTENDIRLLNHELFESKFEGIFKTNYDISHEATLKSGRTWFPEE